MQKKTHFEKKNLLLNLEKGEELLVNLLVIKILLVNLLVILANVNEKI